ncbi:hypothetical protein GCM10008090_12270 [Arenicella chitinivorans]|uniref:Uncharacterized protein n=1 Tax=Arenicella chitinivorans TaxID=1329800 RepID=A0A918VK96_9GAMM|nr:hypothetical protein [Arenicella chitinivorans]GHA04444.1 hypothetical protein GCM10008090_12270 [Arenicella chitinivorans]
MAAQLTKRSPQQKIAYGLWLDDRAPDNVSHPVPLRDLTLSWLRFGYQGEVIESPQIDQILQRALTNGYDACVVFSPGVIINEVWKLPHWGCADFHQCVHTYFDQSDALICANTRQTNGRTELDTACLLFDLQHYAELLRTAPNTKVTSAWIMQLDPSQIPPLPDELVTKFVNVARPSKPHANAFFRSLDTQLQRGRNGVFLWNIEAYDDVAPQQPDSPPVSHLLCVAAGFKPLMLLARRGFDRHTKVTFFDYSQRALEIRQRMIRDWDGRDYPAFCRQVVSEYPGTDTFYQLWDGLNVEQIDWRDVDALWQAELQHWGGAERFAELWNAHRQLDIEFIHCDVVHDPSPVIARLNDDSGVILWWSNAFFTISSNWLLSIPQRRARFQHWISTIANHAPRSTLFGADHNNAPVNNISAAEHCQQIAHTVDTQLSDELKPYAKSVYNLRF